MSNAEPFSTASQPLYDVCAIGNAMVDVIAERPDSFLDTYGIAKGSMSLIDEDRAAFLYEKLGAAVEMSGGSVANSVAGIADLGGNPAYIGRVRDDSLGIIFRHDLTRMGVTFTTPAATQGLTTGRCLIVVTPDAQRSMSTFLGAAADLSEVELDAQMIGNAAVTFLEGYLFDKPEAQKAFYAAAALAHENGRKVALSLSDTFCVERHHEAFTAFARDQVDILLANEFELMTLARAPSVESAIQAVRQPGQIVVGTRSEKGAVLANDETQVVLQADTATRVLDSTGAGDLFAAGFLYGLTHGMPLALAGQLGTITAAEVISHYGPRPQESLKELARRKGIPL